MHIKYRPEMTPEELRAFMERVEEQDKVYAEAFANGGAPYRIDTEDSLDYFNRYVAGDK